MPPVPKKDVEALWREVFGGPPPIDAAPEMLIDVMVRCLPAPAPYGYDGPMSFPPPGPPTVKPPPED